MQVIYLIYEFRYKYYSPGIVEEGSINLVTSTHTVSGEWLTQCSSVFQVDFEGKGVKMFQKVQVSLNDFVTD